jgi:hypothetical protein
MTERQSTLRTHPLEALLFAASIVLLLATMVVTARVAVGASAQSADLTFGGTLDEMALVLSNSGPDRFARLEHATLRLPGGDIAVDTVAILADAADEPAAATGGFIADQVAQYNDHVIRQALIRATLGSAVANSETEAPSLLRAVRTETGERRLSEQPNPFVLTVRSPYAERTWRQVRTADWSSSGSLLGLAGDMALAPRTTDGSRGRLNGRDCTIRRHDDDFLLYCGSVLASDVGRFFDVGFEPDARDPARIPARAFLYRPASLWRNGTRQDFTESGVLAGDVFDVERTGPFMLSVSQRGTLAAGQWINGRQSFSNQRLGTISFFAAAGRSSAASAAEPLVLSLDATLSTDLEAEARRFFEARPALRRMSVVVMDVRTGQLLAIAEPARRSDAEPLLAFEPLLVGSVVKPLVAAAILTRQTQLADMRLGYAGDTVRVVANLPLERGFANAANGCAGSIAFTDFIRCSSNQYAAELLVRSLRADGLTADDVGTVPLDVLERSSIGSGLAEAFDVDAFGWRTAGRNAGLWIAATRTATNAERTADRTLLPWESRPWLAFPGTDGTRLDLLARYAFGGWENRWTLLGVGEAYARIATGREVHATILAGASVADEAPTHVVSAFRRVRSGLQQVPVAGTAAGLAADLQRALGSDVAVLAKTGTLNEQRDRFRSLALVVGVAGSPQQSLQTQQSAAPLSCGLVAVTYFDFDDDAAPHRATRLPPVHLEFARGAFAAVLARHWQRVSGCPAAAADDGAAEAADAIQASPVARVAQASQPGGCT